MNYIMFLGVIFKAIGRMTRQTGHLVQYPVSNSGWHELLMGKD